MLRKYLNKDNTQNLNKDRTTTCWRDSQYSEANKGTYLDQFNNNNMQMRSHTIKKCEKFKKRKRKIHIYIPIKKAIMNQSVSIWREIRWRYKSLPVLFPVNKQYFGSGYMSFLSLLYLLSLCLHIYQTGGETLSFTWPTLKLEHD